MRRSSRSTPFHGAKGGRPLFESIQPKSSTSVPPTSRGGRWQQLGLGLGTVRRAAAAAAERANKAGSSARTVPKAIRDAKEAIL